MYVNLIDVTIILVLQRFNENLCMHLSKQFPEKSDLRFSQSERKKERERERTESERERER